MKMTSITHLGNEHNEWLRSLDFYKQELQMLNKRLEEVAGKNTNAEVAKSVESFNNKFIIHTTNIDTLRHHINENLSTAITDVKTSANHVSQEVLREHEDIKHRFATEETMVNELRHDFNQFLSKWM